MKINFTCFEDFSHVRDNTSRLIVESLGYPYQTLPVSFDRCADGVNYDCDTLIHVGVAASREKISVERYAHNLAHSPIQADNDKFFPHHQKIIAGAPLALETTVPSHLIDQLNGDWEWSLSAGSYVCNALYFKSLWHLHQSNTRCLFVHVPYHHSKPEILNSAKDFFHELCLTLADANL